MLRILIIEDEEPASKRLFKMISEIEPGVVNLAFIEDVSAGIEWLSNNKEPDLIFSDIQLADGISFDIFRQFKLSCPIIFVTAFDQYAINAFKLNSIDYLLKPIKKTDLEAALTKYKTLSNKNLPIDMNRLLEAYAPQFPTYKTRFVVRYGDHIKAINIENISYFNTEDKISFLTTREGRRFAIDYNLDSLESVLDPKHFFRINRQFIISIDSISEMFAYSKSRVLVKLAPATKEETIVSTERSADFKIWLGDGA